MDAWCSSADWTKQKVDRMTDISPQESDINLKEEYNSFYFTIRINSFNQIYINM